MAGAASDQTVFEGQVAVDLFALERICEFLLGGAWTVVRNHRQHRRDDLL